MTGVAELLKDVKSWREASTWQRDAFVAEMRTKQYGLDALTQAWGWFAAGWIAALERVL